MLRAIQREHPRATKVRGKFKPYDIICEGHDDCKLFGTHPATPWTWEVKTDLLSKETGNYGFEYEHNGKPSGLEATEATFWVQFDGDRALTLPTQAFKETLQQLREQGVVQNKTGGDYGAAKMAIVAKQHIDEIPYGFTIEIYGFTIEI